MDQNDKRQMTDISIVKANQIIDAKYNTSLTEDKLLAIALSRVEYNPKEVYPISAKVYANEIKDIISDSKHIYRDLQVASVRMMRRIVIISDGENYTMFTMFPKVTFINGVCTIYFSPDMKPYIMELEQRYTKLNLGILTQFKRHSTFRLYEILKKEAFRIQPPTDSISIEYSLYEFRFTMGMINAENPVVRQAVSKGIENINWEELYAKLSQKDKKYERWEHLEERVIIPAREEINETSDIRFDYEPVRTGRSIKKIRFTIYKKDQEAAVIQEEPGKHDEIPDDMLDVCALFKEYDGYNNLTSQEIKAFLDAAGGDAKIVREAIRKADTKRGEIRNYPGWIIDAIKEDYTNIYTVDGSAEKGEAVKKASEEFDKYMKEHQSEIDARVWAHFMDKDDFREFKEFCRKEGIQVEDLERYHTPGELSQMYADWKFKRKVNFEWSKYV